MSESSVAIVGSGVAATAIAYTLTKKGYDVTVFEKGPLYPYPHSEQFEESTFYNYSNPELEAPSDLKKITLSGDYKHNLNKERYMRVGGSATVWTAITPRMNPQDFQTNTRYGFGLDWPLSYTSLEPFYSKAEAHLGVAGSVDDNPFAPPRSEPYPMPPFELGFDDRVLADRLEKHGLVLHTTPQARNRASYDGRPICQNFGTCDVCPIGARYSPNHHLQAAMQTGLCRLLTNTSVRRIVLDEKGLAKALVYQRNDGQVEEEHAAKVIVLAAGGFETPRLLLLSKDGKNPDGIGNQVGHVGRHLVFHHMWLGSLQYEDRLYTGRVGPITGQSDQFRDPEGRGNHGGIKVEFSSHQWAGWIKPNEASVTGSEVLDDLKTLPHKRTIILHAESAASPKKFVSLSDETDGFGDPLAHVHYDSSDFDYQTYKFAQRIAHRFAAATRGEILDMSGVNEFNSGAHHMGACRMGKDERDSVVNEFGAIHRHPNCFIVGESVFVGTSGSANPTLTNVALALRTSQFLENQLA